MPLSEIDGMVFGLDQAQLRKTTKQGVLQPLGLPLPTLAGLVHAG